MKVAGCRAALGPLRIEHKEHIIRQCL